ncbi:MAG: secretin N-terminal domain-containing protein, partial [Chthoniobacteraceae bacterium]
MRHFTTSLVCLFLFCGLIRCADGANPPAEEQITLQYPNNPVGDILAIYEKLTGKILVRDANLTGPNLNIVAAQPMPKSEAIRLIEAALLLNGYSLIPDSDNHVKVINAAGGKNPRSEGLPLYANSSAIPQDNQVISYFMPFRFLASVDAKSIFQQHVVLHPYGSITEVPNAQALVITENASLIRQLVNLQDLIDVPPARVISEFVTLQRADAERVADVITKLIESQRNEKQKHSQGQNVPAPSGQPASPGTPPGQPVAANNDLFENDLVAGSVQLVPDARTNRILVITRPSNFRYIKNLIEEFDKVVGLSAPLERPLKYISAAEVLPVLADLLTENQSSQNGAAGSQTAAQQTRPTQNSSQNNAGNNGGSSSQTGGGNSHPDVLSEPDGDTGPTSLIVGKTRLIADNKANSILVIGPPESQEKVRTILDKLDKRPPQVYLSTVIGQLKLTKNNEFGVDYMKLFQNAGGGTASHSTGLASSALNTANSLLDPRSLTAAAAFPPTSGLALYGTVGKSISVFVHALESTNRFKVLARPEIYTANNKKAVISSGERIAYPSSTLSNVNTVNNVSNSTAAVASNIDYEDVVLKLEVVPLINANNEVNLKIAQVDDSVAGSQTISGNTVPTISTQSINTTVTVPSGGTVVLGGLITESTTTNLNGIPVLMHLPWVGSLFRDTTKNTERDELIILI